MKEIIERINASETFVRLLEVGAGVPIANEIFNYGGASKTVYSSESYYSRDAFSRMFGESKCRAVSAEKLKDINENISVLTDLKNNVYNTVLSTTFQLSEDIKYSTHGWISLNIKNESIRYYHVSLHYPNNRTNYIKNIGEIGILLLDSKNKSIPLNCYIDVVLDENLKPLYKETLEFISSNSDDTMSVFKCDGSIDRLESITRDIDTLVVYKGSFNPPTLSHKEIIETSYNAYQGNKKGVLCLSYNTFQKGKQSVESFLDRIELINLMGWDVLITSKPLFKDTYDSIRLKFKGNIVFPMGIDTLNRMSKDYNYFGVIDTFIFQDDFKKTEFIIYHRDNELIDPLVQRYMIDTNLVRVEKNIKYHGISSTLVRNLVNNKDFEKIKELVPSEIYNNIISKKYEI